jgi:predicted NUDIX family phosphoesterase
MANEELQESVLVVSRTVVDALCPQTFCRAAEQVKAAVLANCRFLERTVAEHDFQSKQVIPYVVIRHGERYLLMRRTSRQTESRLHHKYSLGIGGHINNQDAASGNEDVIGAGMRRELQEEIHVEDVQSSELVGVINDDSTEVARVHVGLVYLLTAASPRFTIVEHDKYTAMWTTPAEMAGYYDLMESWAQIVYDYVVLAGTPDRVKRWTMPRSMRGSAS